MDEEVIEVQLLCYWFVYPEVGLKRQGFLTKYLEVIDIQLVCPW